VYLLDIWLLLQFMYGGRIEFSQPPPRSSKSRPYGADWDTQNIGNLLILELAPGIEKQDV